MRGFTAWALERGFFSLIALLYLGMIAVAALSVGAASLTIMVVVDVTGGSATCGQSMLASLSAHLVMAGAYLLSEKI